MLGKHISCYLTCNGTICVLIDVGMDHNASALLRMCTNEDFYTTPRPKQHGSMVEIRAQNGVLEEVNYKTNHNLPNTTQGVHTIDSGIYFVDLIGREAQPT